MAAGDKFTVDPGRGSIDSDAFSPGDALQGFVRFLRRQYKTILFAIAAAVALAVVYVIVTPPSFTAQVLIAVDPKRVQLFQARNEAMGETPIDPMAVDSQVEILHSENVVAPVIRKLNLTNDPEFRDSTPLEKAIGFISSLFGDYDSTSESSVMQRTLKAVEDRLNVRRVGTTNVLEISFRSRNPDLSAKVANAISNSYIDDQLEAKYEAAHRASDWLQARIVELRNQVTTAEEAVVDFKKKHNIVDAGGRLMNEQELSELNSQLVVARAQVSEARAKLDRIQSILAAGQGAAVVDATVADSLKSDVVNKLRAQYIELAIREADWAHRYGAGHLAVVALRNHMEGIRRSALEELGRLAETYKSDYDIARQKEENLQKQLTSAVSRVQGASEAQIELRDLESSAKSYRTLHDTFIQRNMESIQHQSVPNVEARVISPASRPLQKSHPRTILSLAIAALGGCLAGIGAGAYRESSDRTFRTGQELETFLSTTCIGVIPKLKPDFPPDAPTSRKGGSEQGERVIKDTGALAKLIVGAPRSRFAESIRAIKLGVERAGPTKAHRVLGITSALPGEGKTSIAACLARAIAQTSARVILIDCDLREAGLTRAFAPGAKVGVVEAAKEQAPLADFLWRDSMSKLVFLPAVAQSDDPHPVEFFASPETKKFFERLRQSYDWVLVDLPPLVPIIDARATTDLVDDYLLIVEWGATKVEVLRRALLSAPELYDRVLGAALNKVDFVQLGVYDGAYEQQTNKYYRDRYVAPSEPSAPKNVTPSESGSPKNVVVSESSSPQSEAMLLQKEE